MTTNTNDAVNGVQTTIMTPAVQKRAEWVKQAMKWPTYRIDYAKLSKARQKALDEYTAELTGYPGYQKWAAAEQRRERDLERDLVMELRAGADKATIKAIVADFAATGFAVAHHLREAQKVGKADRKAAFLAILNQADRLA
jgi:hypothetical protein